MQHQAHGTLDEQVSAAFSALESLIETTLVPLAVRRRLAEMAGVLDAPPEVRPQASQPTPLSPSVVPAAQAPIQRRRSREKSPPRIRRGAGSHVILKALSTAPVEGLHGRDLNLAMVAAGLSIDSAEKVKTAMRHEGTLDHDTGTGFWSLTQTIRDAYPDLRGIVHPMPALHRKEAVDIRDTRPGKVIMDTLAILSPEWTPVTTLYQAAMDHGYAYSTVKHAVNGLRIAGHIEGHGNGPRRQWRLAASPGQTQAIPSDAE